MLIQCPECELQVSDKAINCPHCGYPIKYQEKRPQKSKASHKRLPNGFGQITEIKSKPLRKPFRAMVTIGKDKNGKPICKMLKPESYFATYNDAYKALVEYNRNPYDVEQTMTVSELYNQWSAIYFKKLSTDSSRRTITAAWAYCESIKNINARSLRSRHIKSLLETCGASQSTRNRIKSMFNLMLDYAVEYEIVDKNYARDFSTETVQNINHISFTDDEMKVLWEHTDDDIVNIILFQCYSGWRPSEMFDLQFDWDNELMVGGMKTDAGKNRTVPIHPKVLEISQKIKPMLDTLTYDAYFKKYKSTIAALGLNPDHKPHDGRKTFVTLAKKYNVDEYAIKRIVGHAIPDITEKIYTDRDTNWLKSEISKIDSF